MTTICLNSSSWVERLALEVNFSIWLKNSVPKLVLALGPGPGMVLGEHEVFLHLGEALGHLGDEDRRLLPLLVDQMGIGVDDLGDPGPEGEDVVQVVRVPDLVGDLGHEGHVLGSQVQVELLQEFQVGLPDLFQGRPGRGLGLLGPGLEKLAQSALASPFFPPEPSWRIRFLDLPEPVLLLFIRDPLQETVLELAQGLGELVVLAPGRTGGAWSGWAPPGKIVPVGAFFLGLLQAVESVPFSAWVSRSTRSGSPAPFVSWAGVSSSSVSSFFLDREEEMDSGESFSPRSDISLRDWIRTSPSAVENKLCLIRGISP